jgi:ankyrin repeat protein
MGAVLAGDTEAAELLIDAGAVQGTVPSPLLDTAVQMNNIRMVSLLVRKAHANVNQVNEQGMTPLTWAAITHHTDMARTLLDLGADAGFVDKFGCTALRHTADIWYTDPTTALTLKQASKQRLALASTYK